MKMTIERYIIELKNGEYALFNQTDYHDIQVIEVSENDATMFTKEHANKVVSEMNGISQWNYWGDCVKAKGISKVTLIFGED